MREEANKKGNIDRGMEIGGGRIIGERKEGR